MDDLGKTARIEQIKRYRYRDWVVREGNLRRLIGKEGERERERPRNESSQDHGTGIGATSLRAKPSRGEKCTVRMYMCHCVYLCVCVYVSLTVSTGMHRISTSVCVCFAVTM